ncbi:MAG: M28 family peptidase [Gemmatimonadaceae bacterium]
MRNAERRPVPRTRALLLAGAVGAVALGGGGCASRRPGTAAPAAHAALNAETLRRDLEVFASDSFAGRRTGTPDAMRAARFLAERLAASGVEPAGDSGYYQRVPLARPAYGPGTRFEVRTAAGVEPLTAGEALLPLPRPTGSDALPATRAEGDVVFLGAGVPGGGVTQAELDRMDVGGKVAVVVHGVGAPAPPGEVGRAIEALLPRRPAAVVVLLAGESARLLPQLERQYARLARSGEPYLAPPDSLRTLPMLLLGDAARAAPLLPPGWPADRRPRALAGRRFAGEIDATFTAYNVVGIVRGRDPALRATYVAYGAHYDHIGIQRPAEGEDAGATAADTIANGADDDGSGSVALLAIARAFAGGERPRRSLLFVWHVGEEQGLLGSEHFAAHPTVPIDSIVAQLNADMIGRNAPDSLYVVGPRAAPRGQSRVLGEIVDSVNAALPRPFAVNREWDSPTHPEQIYYRSDHYNYARRGVPVVFFTSGLHADYHRVTDEASKIDYDKLARVGTLLLHVGRAVGERETRPK